MLDSARPAGPEQSSPPEAKLGQLVDALACAREFSDNLIRSSVDGVLAFDSEGRTTVWNPAMERMTGMPASRVMGRRNVELFPFLKERGINDLRAAALRGETVTVQEARYWIPQTGREGLFEARYSPLRDGSGRIIGALGIVREVTERRQAEEALRESQARYALAARAAHDGLWDWNLETQVIFFSPRWKEMAGLSEIDLGGRPADWFDRVHPDDAERLRAGIEAHLSAATEFLECEYRLLHGDGNYRWMLCRGLAVRTDGGQALRLAGSQTDVTARKAAEEQIQHDALHDALTGLPNRTLFMDRLGGALVRARRRSDYPFAVLVLDLDRFKVVNDSLGHAAGDRLLVEMATRLQSSLRDGDTVSRLGGDEFACLLDDAGGAADAAIVANRILEALRVPFTLDGQEIYASASIGIALGSSECERAEDLLRDADTAMDQAKALGKSRHALFQPAMRGRALAELSLESDLRRALERRELRLHFQPVVSLGTGRLAGFEALLRWQHPVRGLIAPGEFIPLAEATGLIIPMGLWVLRTACRQMETWQSLTSGTPPLWVSVNLSGKQLVESRLAEHVENILRDARLDPPSLSLEITESVLIENADVARAVLERLRELGVRVQIDDFGTGFSSLGYLRRLPADGLKVDRSFIGRIAEDIEIVRAIVGLGRSLNLDVVAEGVETADQLDRARDLGCAYAQGFFLCRPLERHAAEAFIRKSQDEPVARLAERDPPELQASA
jgi:diguanylate cyclase (GGDEF)-like protein/PAS domain S-box-containing protein